MHISVHVRLGDPATGLMELTTHCLIVFVGLDEDENR
jgi:4-hydroxybenzoyl-CoA thioesterase